MRTLFIFIILLSGIVVSAQKFMIQGNDTLPYKEKMVIQADTFYMGGKMYYPGDTLYEGACRTFEKINGQVVNETDDQCLSQGHWIITDTAGNYWTGNYHNGYEVGIWKRFDKNGKLLREKEEVHIVKDSYTVKDIDYSTGKPVTVVNRAFLAFYVKNIILITIIFFGSFFTRPFINSTIYNRERGTDLSVMYFGLPFTKDYWNNGFHSLLCVFTLWFTDYKPENRRLVIISNTLSAIALCTFFGTLIGMAISGELH